MTAKRTPPPRVKVAAVTSRLPEGMLRQNTTVPAEVDDKSPPSRRMGRPRKDPAAKAKAFTITLGPKDAEALDALHAKVNEGLPADVPRSALARLAFALLLEMKPQQIRSELSKRR